MKAGLLQVPLFFILFAQNLHLLVKLLRHIDFLKSVFLYALTAFGGPQGHLGMMLKIFVEKRKDVTEDELLELNAFAQMLPGPSSTQTIMLIGYKRGGPILAMLTLFLWILPATTIMGIFSFVMVEMNMQPEKLTIFRFIYPMTIGFIIYSAVKMMEKTITSTATWIIMIVCALLTILVHSPWIIPIMFILSGFISNLSNKRIPEKKEPRKKLKWVNLRIFAYVFIAAGILSELARIYQWEHRRIFNLFENFYRFGSLVYGGGQALLPMMLFQFVSLPVARGRIPYLSSSELMTGFGVVQAIPGPVFSVCTFVGAMAMSEFGPFWQIVGGFVSILAVFLPSTLLMLFFYPVYQNLKRHTIIYRALEGINAMIVGIIWASGVLLFKEIYQIDFTSGKWLKNLDLWAFPFMIATFLLLRYTKLPPPIIVIITLLFGWLV